MKKSYKIIGGLGFTFMLTVVCGSLKAQTRTITGTVTAGNQAISGVSVSQQGSDQTTTTNTQGNYQLQVTGENPVLIFRHPEYADQKIPVKNHSVININLSGKVQGIEEVVLNAGYYKVREKERTGSIAKITSKEIENQPVSNVLSAAQGRMAGVNITQNSGSPGGGFDIQIRGRNSIRTRGNSEIDDNQPLYVVNGIPIGGNVASPYSGTILPEASINPLKSINPDDIESIEILKDADATAIYGSRGANGVVLITTKKAKKGQLSLTLNTAYALSQTFSNLKMMNTEQYLKVRKQAFANDGISTYPANAYDVNGIWDQNRYTDWSKTLIGNTATSSNTQVSLSGGNETTTFLVSLGRQEQTTVFGRDFSYKTHSISTNVSHRSLDRKFIINLSNMFSTQENNVLNQDITRSSFLLSPNAPALYDEYGNLNWENNTFNNPVAAYNATYSNKNLQFLNNLSTEYEIASNFKIKLNSGLNYQTFEEWSLRPIQSIILHRD